MSRNMGEFNIIETYFKQKTQSRSDVLLGIGDDGALLKARQEQALVVSIDTLAEGTHFLPHCSAYDLDLALAVNLRLAAMGAEAAWIH